MKLTVKTLQGVAFPLEAELTDTVRLLSAICCLWRLAAAGSHCGERKLTDRAYL